MGNKPVQITRRKALKIEPFETADMVYLTDDERLLFDSLADLLEYPYPDWPAKFEACKEICLKGGSPEAEYFSEFCLEIYKFSLLELEELYTRTFDLNPVCALEIGYHLFGEDYKRGAFLANLRETEDPFELGQEFQLPDYLPVVLRLLGKMDDAELRASLIGYCLIPAIDLMLKAFDKKNNQYRHVVRFLNETLKRIASESIAKANPSEEVRYEYA